MKVVNVEYLKNQTTTLIDKYIYIFFNSRNAYSLPDLGI